MAELKPEVHAMALRIYETLVRHKGVFYAYTQKEWEKVLGSKLTARDMRTITPATAFLSKKNIIAYTGGEGNVLTLLIPIPSPDDWYMGLPHEIERLHVGKRLYADIQAIKKIDLLDKPDRKKPGRKKNEPPDATGDI
jgi:hypothetical protein